MQNQADGLRQLPREKKLLPFFILGICTRTSGIFVFQSIEIVRAQAYKGGHMAVRFEKKKAYGSSATYTSQPHTATNEL